MAAVRQAIQQCGVQLKAKIARQQAAREQAQRKRNLTKRVRGGARAKAGRVGRGEHRLKGERAAGGRAFGRPAVLGHALP